jgi:hypothetical protein
MAPLRQQERKGSPNGEPILGFESARGGARGKTSEAQSILGKE